MSLQALLTSSAVLIVLAQQGTNSGLPVSISKPKSIPAKTFEVDNKDHFFSPDFKKKNGIGPETSWAGFSKSFSIDLPTSLAKPKKLESGILQGSYVTPSGGSVSFIVLDPVAYEYQGVVPKQDLEKDKISLFAQIKERKASDAIVADKWTGHVVKQFTVRKRTNAIYWFFFGKEYLEVNLYWKTGDVKQEQEAKSLMAYGLWSIKIKPHR